MKSLQISKNAKNKMSTVFIIGFYTAASEPYEALRLQTRIISSTDPRGAYGAVTPGSPTSPRSALTPGTSTSKHRREASVYAGLASSN